MGNGCGLRMRSRLRGNDFTGMRFRKNFFLELELFILLRKQFRKRGFLRIVLLWNGILANRTLETGIPWNEFRIEWVQSEGVEEEMSRENGIGKRKSREVAFGREGFGDIRCRKAGYGMCGVGRKDRR